MAKRQRSLHLPAEAFDLIAAVESNSGAKLNRVVLAAVLQYFGGTDAERQAWMSRAVRVDKGQLTLADALKGKDGKRCPSA